MKMNTIYKVDCYNPNTISQHYGDKTYCRSYCSCLFPLSSVVSIEMYLKGYSLIKMIDQSEIVVKLMVDDLCRKLGFNIIVNLDNPELKCINESRNIND